MSTIRALVIKTSGDVYAVFVDSEDLTDIQAEVGGYVEVLAVREGMDVWVNDMGALTLPPNPVASLAVSMLGGIPRKLFGPVVFTGGHDAEGNSKDIGDGPETVLNDYARALSNTVKSLVSQDMHEWAVATLGRPAN